LLTVVCLSLAGLCLASLSLVSQFDRYMVLYLPLLLVPASLALHQHPPAKPAVMAALATTLLYAVFSVSAVHDYMAWNRTRWQAIRYLTNNLGVPAERLDGGFEFNGVSTYSEDYIRTPGKSPWWVKDDEYVIAFDVLPGYRVFKLYPVRQWLPAGIKQIYVLRREGHPTPADSPAGLQDLRNHRTAEDRGSSCDSHVPELDPKSPEEAAPPSA